MTLDEIRKLIEAATPGPWAYRIFEIDPITCIIRRDNVYPGEAVADSTSFADAEFITAARTLLPALLDVAEAAQRDAEPCMACDLNYSGCDCTCTRPSKLPAALAALEALKLP